MSDVMGGTIVDAMRAHELARKRLIEQALRDAGITESNAAEYRFVEDYLPGRRNRLLGVTNRQGEWVIRFDDEIDAQIKEAGE